MHALAGLIGARNAVRAALSASLLIALLAASPSAADSEVDAATEVFQNLDAELSVTGMTFVGSRGDVNAFVLRADRAIFRPQTNLAQLEGVEFQSTAASGPKEARRNFDVRCDRGELNVETNDFLAEGDVRGSTGDGRRYQAPWVRYNHEQQLLYTDAPVQMQDDTGTFKGDGFRYYLKERRFRLLGNVSLVQTQ